MTTKQERHHVTGVPVRNRLFTVLAITPSGLCPIIFPCSEVCGTQFFFALEMHFEHNGISMTAIICHQGSPTYEWRASLIQMHYH